MNYDVILLAGFGGPRQLADVVPFLRNVTAGKAIPDARLEQVGAHYRLFDGHSPINEQTEALRDALAAALLAEGIKLPVVIGNRNWHPFTIDALRPDGTGEFPTIQAAIAAACARSPIPVVAGCLP